MPDDTRLIVELGTSLGLQVVAEGVEDEETRAKLADMECPVAQGFLFAAPMTDAEVIHGSINGVRRRCR